MIPAFSIKSSSKLLPIPIEYIINLLLFSSIKFRTLSLSSTSPSVKRNIFLGKLILS